jgi:hypothetical protein
MRLFQQDVVDSLNKYFSTNEEYVANVSLLASGLSIQTVSIRIGSGERTFYNSSNETFVWDGDNPDGGPWGNLVRQLAIKANLESPQILRIHFESGDFLDIETVEGQYESVIIEFPKKGDTHSMDIY